MVALVYFIVIIILLGVFLISRPRCGSNAEYTPCGTACPLTCEHQAPRPCTLQCVIGCQCKKGFVRDKTGRCVTPNKCPK